MPRTPRNSPTATGRPRKPAADAAAALVLAGKASSASAARKLGVGLATVEGRVRVARKAAKSAKPKGTPPAAPASSPGDRRAALLAVLSDALAADPVLVAALPLDAVELARRLRDPSLLEGDLDPLAILGRVQGRLERDMMGAGVEVIDRKNIAQALVTLASAAERIKLGRPAETEAPDVLASRKIDALRDAALAKVFEHVGTEEARAA